MRRAPVIELSVREGEALQRTARFLTTKVRDGLHARIASMAPAATSSITANSQPSPQPVGTKKGHSESTPTIAFDRE